MSGRFPIAKKRHPVTVTYQAELVSHDGALWQALQDTAQSPGGPHWQCVARAGRDAVTPTIRGTYDFNETYRELDVVACDGASFVAKQDNPGMCPSDGWQLLCRQGKRGHKGEPGERGPKGDSGPPAELPRFLGSEIDQDYNLIM